MSEGADGSKASVESQSQSAPQSKEAIQQSYGEEEEVAEEEDWEEDEWEEEEWEEEVEEYEEDAQAIE